MTTKTNRYEGGSQQKDRLYHLLKSKELTDVEFHVGSRESERRVFKAHRLILSLTSPVFRACLYGDRKEEQIIQVTDIDPRTFQLVLEYIYSETLELKHLSYTQVKDLLNASYKYRLTHLKRQCSDRLGKDNLRIALEDLLREEVFDGGIEKLSKIIQRDKPV